MKTPSFGRVVRSFTAGISMVTEFRILASAALTFFLIAPPMDARAQDVFQSVRLAEGVWASMVVSPHSPSQYSNSLLVVGSDGALLVDTRSTPTSARALVEWVRSVTPLPVTHVVNTHRHSDHVYGNQTVMNAFPDAQLIGHVAMALWMEREGPAQLDSDRAGAHQRVERWGRWLANGRTDGGRELGPAQIEELTAAIERTGRRLDDLNEVELVAPNLAVSDSLDLHDGVRSIRILHPGPAHTDGDLVVYLPDEAILWAGDLIEEGFPYFDHGTVSGWAEAMGRLEAHHALRVISSHGRATADDTSLRTQGRFWRTLVAGVREMVESGATEDAAVDGIRLDGFREYFTFGDADAAERYAGFVEEAVRACYGELQAGTP